MFEKISSREKTSFRQKVGSELMMSWSLRCLFFLHWHNGAPSRQRGSATHAGHHYRCAHISYQPIGVLGSAPVKKTGPAAPAALPHQAHEVELKTL